MPLTDLIAKRQQIDARRGYRRRWGDKRHRNVAWIRSQPGIVYMGGESVTIAKRRLKYVQRSAPYAPYSSGELARIYLDDLIRDQLHDTRIPDHFKMTPDDERKLAIPAPLYFDHTRGRDGRFVYIDIAACYFELMKGWPLNVGFDVESGKTFMPRPELRIPQSDWGWLRQEKPLRHAIFGMLNAPEIGWYQDGVWKHHKTLGRYAAPDLVALVKTQLRQIAREAVESFGCLMWLTDAGVFPKEVMPHDSGLSRPDEVNAGAQSSSDAPASLYWPLEVNSYAYSTLPLPPGQPFQVHLASLWHLDSHVKAQGAGHLYAQGSYRIGRLRTHTEQVDLPGWSNL